MAELVWFAAQHLLSLWSLPREAKDDTFLGRKSKPGSYPRTEEDAIKQAILPIIPFGATPINSWVSVQNDGVHCSYFVGVQPVYRHPVGELRLFRLVAAQLIDSACCRPCEIIKTFGVSKSSIDRALRAYRREGVDAFSASTTRKSKGKGRQGRVMNLELIQEAQRLLDSGMTKSEVADQLGVSRETFRRAVWDGRLVESQPTRASAGTDKSERSLEDMQAAQGLGTACTRNGERILAAFGAIDGASTQFEPCRGVAFGGVLCALGALLANGLLGPAKELLGKVKGYYTSAHILLLLAFMALCRIKTVEQLRGKAPGELGKLMGLDRVPEVRCLRAKLDALSDKDAAQKWMAALSRQWMEEEPEAVGTLYIDGHVRVYHGSQTPLPRKYVSRQRLCLRGTTDYWVNDQSGLPFFVIDKVVDPGLIKVLRQDIVPRLLREVPSQPSREELAADPYRARFILVFDREAYSPGLFKELWQQHRIACITYHKHPATNWPESEFAQQTFAMPNGEQVTMKLAERGSWIGGGKEALWVKEARKLTDQGHQVSVISTAYGLEAFELGGRMFTRWCQENFFRYMMQHFAIDLLSDYKKEPLHDTATVVNPLWRQWERKRNSLENKLRYRQARFTQWSLHTIPASKPKRYRKHEEKKARLLEEIQQLEAELVQVKATRQQTPKHIPWKDLPEQDRFDQPCLGRKRLMDAVRMIAYRAETAMCSLLDDSTLDTATARRLLQDLFVTEADLLPEPESQLLHVQIHRSSRPAVDRALSRLFDQLNQMQFKFPGTQLELRYRLLGEDPAPPPQNGVNDTSQR